MNPARLDVFAIDLVRYGYSVAIDDDEQLEGIALRVRYKAALHVRGKLRGTEDTLVLLDRVVAPTPAVLDASRAVAAGLLARARRGERVTVGGIVVVTKRTARSAAA
jgi:hypothetical protein